jgi:hypothetical protein
MSSQPDPAERFRLPDSFASVGDPVEGNPFPIDHPLHQVWIGATRKAEEEVCHNTATALLNLAPSAARDWPAALILAKFDAWAQRGASVVWSDRAVQHYDQWLVAYANSWLDQAAQPYTSAPPADPVDGSLMELRNRLGAQVHAWEAVARRACAEHQSALTSHPGLPPDAGTSTVFDKFLSDNPFPEHDPSHRRWIETTRHLADELTRIESAFWSVRPTADGATTFVDSLARWTADCFDVMAGARMVIVVHDESEASEQAYWAVLEALRDQALKMVDPLQARVSGRAEALIAAFPGPTMSNAECVALMADVNFLLTPAVTQQVFRRKAYRWMQACWIAQDISDHPMPFAPETPTWPGPARPAVETASDEVTAPQTDSPPSSQEADGTVSSSAPLGGAAQVLTGARETVALPAEIPMSDRGWGDVEIWFLSDFTFQARVKGTLQAPQNYADVGFGDGRHGRPTAAWETLRALAESGGVMASTRTAAEWPKLEKRIQEIRKRLRTCFSLDGDPVPYVKGGYRTRFTIRVSASYDR